MGEHEGCVQHQENALHIVTLHVICAWTLWFANLHCCIGILIAGGHDEWSVHALRQRRFEQPSGCSSECIRIHKAHTLRRKCGVTIYLEQLRNGLVVQQGKFVCGETLAMDFVRGRALQLCRIQRVKGRPQVAGSPPAGTRLAALAEKLRRMSTRALHATVCQMIRGQHRRRRWMCQT